MPSRHIMDVWCRNRPDDQHSAIPKAVTIEQTHNRAGGRVLSMRYLASLKAWAAANNLVVHMDGARMFNAAQSLGVLRGCVVGIASPVALPCDAMSPTTHSPNLCAVSATAGVSVKEVAAQVDTMTFCLSKVRSLLQLWVRLWVCCVHGGSDLV
jgi:threonine aldolase